MLVIGISRGRGGLIAAGELAVGCLHRREAGDQS